MQAGRRAGFLRASRAAISVGGAKPIGRTRSALLDTISSAPMAIAAAAIADEDALPTGPPRLEEGLRVRVGAPSVVMNGGEPLVPGGRGS